MTMPALLPLGQLVYITSVQTNMLIYAVITDGATPNLNTISIQVNGDTATAIVPGLQGIQGPGGAPQFALAQQPAIFSSPTQLPTTLTEANFGQFWWIINYDQNNNPVSSAAYVWWGSFYRVVPIGTVGPTGPYPVITPQVILIDPDMQSYVENTGSISNPSWTFYLAVPAGLPGPPATIAGCPDVNETIPPTPGQVLGFAGSYNQGLPVYQPMTVGALNPLPYIVPESAFQAFSGIATQTQTVCTYTVPANPYPWKPLVFGQVLVSGLNIGLTPLLVGVEVLMGDPTTGQLVAIGYGNAFGGAVDITPQTSTAAAPNAAMTPTNSTALVQAGQPAVFYVNLVNVGMAGVYDFSNQNAQLLILAVPAQTEGAVNALVYGSLTTKASLSAFSVTQGANAVHLLPAMFAHGQLSCGVGVQGKLSAHGVLTCNAHT
jgi:hypothetical protein